MYIVVFRQTLWRWVLGCSWEAVGLFWKEDLYNQFFFGVCFWTLVFFGGVGVAKELRNEDWISFWLFNSAGLPLKNEHGSHALKVGSWWTTWKRKGDLIDLIGIQSFLGRPGRVMAPDRLGFQTWACSLWTSCFSASSSTFWACLETWGPVQDRTSRVSGSPWGLWEERVTSGKASRRSAPRCLRDILCFFLGNSDHGKWLFEGYIFFPSPDWSFWGHGNYFEGL